jgi:hypothetical protein
MESQMPIAAGASAGSPRYPSLLPPPVQQNGGSWARPWAQAGYLELKLLGIVIQMGWADELATADGSAGQDQQMGMAEWDIWWFYVNARVLWLYLLLILRNIPCSTENVP